MYLRQVPGFWHQHRYTYSENIELTWNSLGHGTCGWLSHSNYLYKTWGADPDCDTYIHILAFIKCLWTSDTKHYETENKKEREKEKTTKL